MRVAEIDGIKVVNFGIDVLRYELDVLKKFSMCQPALLAEIQQDLASKTNQTIDPKRSLLDDINSFELQRQLADNFKNSDFMDAMTCFYELTLVKDKATFQAEPYVKEYFYLSDNKSNGQFGLVFKARQGDSKLTFIIKSANYPVANDNIIHEAFIGLTELNKLRKYCPNFAQTYGLISCAASSTISTSICDSNMIDKTGAPAPYVIYEYVEGPPLATWISQPNLSLEDIFAAFYQVYFSCKLAFERASNWVHGDLHSENVIMKPLENYVVLKYDNFEVRTKWIAVIIDYEYSEISVDNRIFSGKIKPMNVHREDKGTNVNRILDMMRLFGFSYLRTENNQLKAILNNIYGYFYNGLKPSSDPSFKQFNIKNDHQSAFKPSLELAQNVMFGSISFDGLLRILQHYMPLQLVNNNGIILNNTIMNQVDVYKSWKRQKNPADPMNSKELLDEIKYLVEQVESVLISPWPKVADTVAILASSPYPAEAYKGYILALFNLLLNNKDSIVYNNKIFMLDQNAAHVYRKTITDQTLRLRDYLMQQVFPWRSGIAAAAASGKFGPKSQMIYNINETSFPVSFNFEPIL